MKGASLFFFFFPLAQRLLKNHDGFDASATADASFFLSLSLSFPMLLDHFSRSVKAR